MDNMCQWCNGTISKHTEFCERPEVICSKQNGNETHTWVLRLSDYEIQSLKELLTAINGSQVPPLSIINTGDWTNQILNKIKQVSDNHVILPSIITHEDIVFAINRWLQSEKYEASGKFAGLELDELINRMKQK